MIVMFTKLNIKYYQISSSVMKILFLKQNMKIFLRFPPITVKFEEKFIERVMHTNVSIPCCEKGYIYLFFLRRERIIVYYSSKTSINFDV